MRNTQPEGGAAGLGLAVTLIGAMSPAAARRAYVVWARVAKKVSDAVAAYVTRLLFVVVAIAGKGGSSFLLGSPSPGQSAWTPKSPVRPDDYPSQHSGPGENESGWRRSYLAWGAGSGRLWTWSLYPLLALLGLVQTQEKGSFGGNVYTLY